MKARFALGASAMVALACGFTVPLAYAATAPAVDGTVNDALGRPLADVVVSLKAADGHVAASTRTDAQGHFHFDGVVPGNYEMTADKASFTEGSNPVTVVDANVSTSLTLASTQALQVVAAKHKHVEKPRNTVSPDTGGSVYKIGQKDIENLPQGDSTSFNQVLLQAPGVAQDSFGQLHVRGDHGDLQYRLNGVILPESISGFGQTLDTHFVQSANLLTGALPAEYGYRTAGVVDIQTRSSFANSGSIGVTAGSFGTEELHGDAGGSKDNFNYYLSGSLLRNDIGVENPAPTKDPLHDDTQQAKGFGYFSWLVGDSSRLSLILGSSTGRFQIPNNPNQTPGFTLAGYPNNPATGLPNYPSSTLQENQAESTQYGILALQGSLNDQFDYQLALFSRYTSVQFNPDVPGDLIYNGLATTVQRSGWDTGLQADGTYRLNSRHTLRMGAFTSAETLVSASQSLSFPANAAGGQASDVPVAFDDSATKMSYLNGVYLQDEWKATDRLTINYGARADEVNAYVTAGQLSPRLGAVYQLTPDTVLHAGYAKYFTPPPTELVSLATIQESQGTVAAPATTQNDSVKPERDDYYDLGITHQLTSALNVGVDSYYKRAKDLLDEGQFGTALLFTPFNYREGEVYGVEFTSNYKQDNFSAYFNLARSTALGKDLVSSQYVFGADEQTYIANNWIHLDHDQMLTASGGVAYLWHDVNYSADLLAGSGLRRDFANTEHLPGYTQVNLSASRTFVSDAVGKIQGRVSVVNLLDRGYEIRDGSGVGVGAPQFGPRRGLYVTVDKLF